MKLHALITLGFLGLSACTNHQGPTANCFDRDTVTRSSNSLSFLPVSRGPVSTGTAPVSDCTFTAMDGPEDAEAK